MSNPSALRHLRFLEFDQGKCAGDSVAIALADSAIDIWSFALSGTPASIAGWHSMLDAEENARAERFVFERLRAEHVVAHGITRWLLGRYADADPVSLQFVRGKAGKPCLFGRGAEVAFNLSHSHGRGLLAVAHRPVGADLEKIRADLDFLEIAERYFFGDELMSIRSQPSARQSAAFFRYWVAKEAVLKGEGIGLGFPLDSFEVRFNLDNECEASVRSDDPARLGSDWIVRMLPSVCGWPAAIAARGADWTMRLRA